MERVPVGRGVAIRLDSRHRPRFPVLRFLPETAHASEGLHEPLLLKRLRPRRLPRRDQQCLARLEGDGSENATIRDDLLKKFGGAPDILKIEAHLIGEGGSHIRLREPLADQCLVRPDGTVGLGVYGSVYVTGMTLQQARNAIEQHLSQHIHRPEVSVDVLAYNSKVYYVITDGGGAGEQVYRIPTTGNETVLDAIAGVNGLPTVASKASIWIARPTPDSGMPDQVLKVDWNAIAQGAQTSTNYQMLPGDRLYVKASPLITMDTKLAKFTAPIERLLGFTILGNGAARSIQGNNANGGF